MLFRQNRGDGSKNRRLRFLHRMKGMDNNPRTTDQANTDSINPIIINEVQMILAEKRTSLAVTRTAIAILAVPLSIMGLLIATSKYYDVLNVLYILLPLIGLSSMLILLGTYMIIRSILSLRHQDQYIKEIKRQNTQLGKFMD